MTMYRIRRHPVEPLPEGEYWRERHPHQERDLDFEEIDAINAHASRDDAEAEAMDDAEELTPIRPFRRRWVQLLLTLAAAVGFAAICAAPYLSRWGDLGFLRRSAELGQDESLAQLRDAVVSIEGQMSGGSGFNISADGLIVTNLHVVKDSPSVIVTFPDGSTYAASSYEAIPGVDLALLDIAADGDRLPAVSLTESVPEAGEKLIFIGNPLGYDWTISEAAALGLVDLGGMAALYLAGPVYPGCSGSPVFNAASEVVAVIFASAGEGEQGLAIPVGYLLAALAEE